MKFKDFSESDLHTLPEINWADLRLLWYSDFYDGPRSGVLIYQNQKYWFENPPAPATEDKGAQEQVQDFFAKYVLMIQLTAEQLATEEAWHELFRQKVGTHTDYDENGNPSVRELRPHELWHEFYDAYHGYILDLSQNEIIGWFRW